MNRFILHCAWSPFVSFPVTGMKGLRLRNYSMVTNLNLRVSQYDLFTIVPLELTDHVVQNRQAGEQKSHWDKTNKGNYHLNYVAFCLSCLGATYALQHGRLFHVNGLLQSANYSDRTKYIPCG